jgi:thiamine-monophosphate kinase
MDVSDGLLTDLDKLCAASHCGARVDIDALPISAAARTLFSAEACVDYALAGGDDYEMMFTVPPARLADVTSMVSGVHCTQIGTIAGNSVECWRAGQPFVAGRRGYDHFSSSDPRP